MSEFVFRVQDSEGRGPFRPGFSQRWLQDRPDHDNLRPWYVEFGRVDRRAMLGMHLGCGCRTVEQLRRWFTPKEYQTLAHYGYAAVRMEVGWVLAESPIQLVFTRSKPLDQEVEPVFLYLTGILV